MNPIFGLFGLGAVAGAMWLTKNDSGRLGSTMTDEEYREREMDAYTLMRDDFTMWNDSAERLMKFGNDSIRMSWQNPVGTGKRRLLHDAADDFISAISVAKTGYGINCMDGDRNEEQCSRSLDIGNESRASIRDIGELLAEVGQAEAKKRFSKLPWYQRLWMK